MALQQFISSTELSTFFTTPKWLAEAQQQSVKCSCTVYLVGHTEIQHLTLWIQNHVCSYSSCPQMPSFTLCMLLQLSNTCEFLAPLSERQVHHFCPHPCKIPLGHGNTVHNANGPPESASRFIAHSCRGLTQDLSTTNRSRISTIFCVDLPFIKSHKLTLKENVHSAT